MTFDAQYFDIGRLDRLSYRDTFVHHLDPRAKVIATMLFLFTVISFPKYEVVALVPFFLFPVLLMTLGEIPVRFILKKVIARFTLRDFHRHLQPDIGYENRCRHLRDLPYPRDGSPFFRFS